MDFKGHNGAGKRQSTFEAKRRGIALNLMPLSFVVRARGISWHPGSERVKESKRKSEK